MAGEKLSISITINLHWLGTRLQRMNRPYIHLHELADMLSTSPQTAGKVASMLVKLGYLERWSKSVYRIKRPVIGDREAVAWGVTGY